MKFLFLLASVAILSIAVTVTSAYFLPQKQLAPELQFLLDSLIDLTLSDNKKFRGDERIEQMRALMLPFFIYSDADQDGFVSEEEYKAFLEKVMPYVLPKLLALIPPKYRLKAQEDLSKVFPQLVEETFAEVDANGDGRMSLREALNSIH